jgi:ribonuclease D
MAVPKEGDLHFCVSELVLSLRFLKMSSTNPGKTISHDEINALPLKAFMGQILLITKAEQLPEAFAEIQKHDVVGFDTETKPAFVKGQVFKVALLQLAIPEKVFLIRLNQTGFTPEIAAFFENADVIKAGVGLRDDIKTLARLGKFNPAGFAELSTMARETGLEVESVKKLTALLLGFRISKGAQTSNWEAEQLNEKQIVYAATDAWVCLEIYKKLKNGIRN